jgi:hypothetical protein
MDAINDVLDLFLEAGIERDHANAIMHQATQLRGPHALTLVKRLISHDVGLVEACDIGSGFCDGQTPLFWVMAKPNVEIVDFLIEHGADVNKRLISGKETPLIWCFNSQSTAGMLSIVKPLLAAGADASACDAQGAPVLVHAMRGERPRRRVKAAVQLLLSAGARVCEPHEDSRTSDSGADAQTEAGTGTGAGVGTSSSSGDGDRSMGPGMTVAMIAAVDGQVSALMLEVLLDSLAQHLDSGGG